MGFAKYTLGYVLLKFQKIQICKAYELSRYYFSGHVNAQSVSKI